MRRSRPTASTARGRAGTGAAPDPPPAGGRRLAFRHAQPVCRPIRCPGSGSRVKERAARLSPPAHCWPTLAGPGRRSASPPPPCPGASRTIAPSPPAVPSPRRGASRPPPPNRCRRKYRRSKASATENATTKSAATTGSNTGSRMRTSPRGGAHVAPCMQQQHTITLAGQHASGRRRDCHPAPRRRAPAPVPIAGATVARALRARSLWPPLRGNCGIPTGS